MSGGQYGFGEHPPYSLYQAGNGKWGLVDGTGAKLDAVFDRIDEERFSQVLCWHKEYSIPDVIRLNDF